MDNSGVFFGTKSNPAGTFGDGRDGDLVLLADLTLPAGVYYKNYRNVHLNGFTLTTTNGNPFLCIRVSGNLDFGNGGKILAPLCAEFASENQNHGSDGGNGNVGGDGGIARGAVVVYAKSWSGTGTINADGQDGHDGTDATTALGNGGPAGGGDAQNLSSWLGIFHALNTLNGTSGMRGHGGDGGSFGATSNGGAQCVGVTAILRQLITDPGRLLNPTQHWDGTNDLINFLNHYWNTYGGDGGGGGGGGARAATDAFYSTGGGGGGGGGFLGNGGKGGTGGKSPFLGGTIPANAGGGAGGGAGAGGLCIFVTTGGTGILRVSANGGKGGKGGAGLLTHGGGGGGGGGGGRCIYMGPTSVVATADGGLGGAAGHEGGGPAGDACGPGDPGTAGIVDNLQLVG